MAQTATLGKTATKVHVAPDGYTEVRYHWTTIIRFNHRGTILNSGGYMTATTKLRMNQASNQFHLGYSIYQRDWKWYVVLSNGDTIPYTDWMVIDRA